MRSRYRVDSESGVYFITSTVVDWVPIFINEEMMRILLDSFKYCQRKKGLLIFGFVIMPNHFHMLIGMEEPDRIPSVVRDLKRHTSQEITRCIAASEKQRHLFWLKPFWGRKNNTVWQTGYHPILIKSEKWLEEKLEYMHMNPVKRGFVEEPQYWKYSSARNYISDDHSLIRLDFDEM